MRIRVIMVSSLILSVMVLMVSSITAQGDRIVVTNTIDNDQVFVQIPFSINEEGQEVVIDMSPQSGEAGGNLDTLLYLIDQNGQIISSNDDRAENDTSSFIRFPEIPIGEYRVIATRYASESGQSSGAFELTIDFHSNQNITLDYDITNETLLAIGFPEVNAKPTATWTIINYYGGENTLEEAVIEDMKEFEIGGGTNDDVNVVMLIDRHPEISRIDGDWQSTRLYEVQNDQSNDKTIIDSLLLKEFDNQDTGNGEFFAQYLVWAIRNYPAENYAIALASHGSGWGGIITDDGSADILTLPELESAFKLAIAEAGVDKFNLLINDACQMSSIEYHDVISSYFLYSYASPEIVVNPALDMTLFLDEIKAGETDMLALGRTLVDKYINEDVAARQGSDSVYLTNAVTDLTKFATLKASIDHFADTFNTNPVFYSDTLGKARSNAYTYSAFLGEDSLIDIGTFMQQIIQRSRVAESDLREAAEIVLLNLDAIVPYANAGERALDRVSYQNIYFPPDGADLQNRYFDETNLDKWGAMLRQFYSVVTPNPWSVAQGGIPFHGPRSPKLKLVGIYPETNASVEQPFDMKIEIVGTGVTTGDSIVDFVQADGTAIRYLSSRILTTRVDDNGQVEFFNKWYPGVDRAQISWDVTLPVVTDSTNSYNELLVLTKEENIAALDGRYREPGSELWNDVTVVFDYLGNFQRVINRSSTDALGVTSIPEGSDFETYSSIVSPDGRTTREPGNRYIWGENGLSWSWQPAPSGDYKFGLIMTTYGGTKGFLTIPVVVNNAVANPAVRAASRTDIGFIFPRPSTWNEPGTRINNNTGARSLVSTDEGSTSSISAFFSIPESPELALIVEDVIANYELISDGDYTPVTINGVPGLQFNYTYQNEDIAQTGKGFAVYQPVTGIGIIVGVASTEPDYPLDELFDFAQSYFRLLTEEELSALGVENWTLYYGNTFDYYQPYTWYPPVVESGWEIYYPDGDSQNSAFYATQQIPAEPDTADSVINQIFTEDLESSLTNLSRIETQTLNAEYNRWQVAIYTGERDGKPVIGRVYVAIVQTDAYDEEGNSTGETANFAHIIHVEASSEANNAKKLFEEIFEPIVESYYIYSVE